MRKYCRSILDFETSVIKLKSGYQANIWGAEIHTTRDISFYDSIVIESEVQTEGVIKDLQKLRAQTLYQLNGTYFN